ncbi:MAG: dihydrofolate reductase [Halobacteriaceae archaeon]
MEVVLIAAVAANGVIGRDGEIPWHHSADLQRFKRLTTGHPVIMGRVTYEGIREDLGGPLPDRTNIVLTRGDLDVASGVVVVHDVEAALTAAAETGSDTVFVAGGESVYRAFLPRADRLELTELDDAHEGDTYFPEWDHSEWVEQSRESHEAFDFVTYVRR